MMYGIGNMHVQYAHHQMRLIAEQAYAHKIPYTLTRKKSTQAIYHIPISNSGNTGLHEWYIRSDQIPSPFAPTPKQSGD